jgi:uncharacterized protein (TIGR00725 family)
MTRSSRKAGRPSNSRRTPVIAVCGSDGDDRALTPKTLRWAEEVGSLLAREGAVLVCGGKGGIMEAASRGARNGGGIVVGLLPRGREEANPYVSIPLATHIGHVRNFMVASMADVVIGIGGRWGTLNEVSYALNIQKPAVVLKGSGGWADLLARHGRKFAGPPLIARSPAEAVSLALRAARARLGE